MNDTKRIIELEAEVKKLQSHISNLLDAQSVADKYDTIDTVVMPRGFSLREKMEWIAEPRNDGSGKLYRVELVGDCIFWTGRLKGQYAILDHNDKKWRVQTLAKVVADTPEIEPSWKDDIQITSAYKQKTQIEKLVGAHQCHNKRCVNPDHIEFRTNAANRQESFYTGRQTKGTEQTQKLIYDFFLEMTDFVKIVEQLHEYDKSIGMKVGKQWSYLLVRGEKYIVTPLGQEYKPLLAKKWEEINKSNPLTNFPKDLKIDNQK
jgi:hypothetical protein